ncbi:hypothetical protein Droror1_Dr00028189 [Drosera rotundifolia]
MGYTQAANLYRDMVIDAYASMSSHESQRVDDDVPPPETREFFEMLSNAERPLFTNYQVASTVGVAIRSYYNGPYTCWSRLPSHDQKIIWKHFRAKYKWDQENAQAVFNEFKHKCMKGLADTANKAAKRPANQLPKWLSPEDKFQELKTLQVEAEGTQDCEHCPASESELFLKATAGFLPNWTVLGLGFATRLFYEKSIRASSSSGWTRESRAVTNLKE